MEELSFEAREATESEMSCMGEAKRKSGLGPGERMGGRLSGRAVSVNGRQAGDPCGRLNQ